MCVAARVYNYIYIYIYENVGKIKHITNSIKETVSVDIFENI